MAIKATTQFCQLLHPKEVVRVLKMLALLQTAMVVQVAVAAQIQTVELQQPIKVITAVMETH
jgi:hypothetical protein